MKVSKAFNDLLDVNKKNGALILGVNRLDDYATKFLTQHCKEALLKPMALPVDQILNKMQLKVHEVSLSKDLDVFGCCLLLDSEVRIFDVNSGFFKPKKFEKGSILIDPNVVSLYGEGFRRNTIIHEIIHWEKDKTFFEILQFKNQNETENYFPIMCKQSDMFFQPSENIKTLDNEIKWLEWQAHRLAPRILMPKINFKNKTNELIEKYKDNLSCDRLVQELSEFFIVSRTSVKYRLLEIGYEDIISELEDFSIVYGEVTNNNEFVKISSSEAIKMLAENSSLDTWLKQKQLVFVEGYFVKASIEYVSYSEGALKLTQKARKNIKKIAVNLREQRIYDHRVNKDYLGFSLLTRSKEIDERLVTFHPKYQTHFDPEPNEIYQAFADKILSIDYNEEQELTKMIGDPTITLCNCLWLLMENRNWNYPEVFNEKTELHKNYHGKIKNNTYNNMTTTVLFAICVGLKLTLRITEKLFEKSSNKLNYFKDPDKTYIKIMETIPGLNIYDFNAILDELGVKQLGSDIK